MQKHVDASRNTADKIRDPVPAMCICDLKQAVPQWLFDDNSFTLLGAYVELQYMKQKVNEEEQADEWELLQKYVRQEQHKGKENVPLYLKDTSIQNCYGMTRT